MLRFLGISNSSGATPLRSRNSRLSAIRSCFRLVALRDPDSLGVVTRVLAIPVKREDRKLIGYLTRRECGTPRGTGPIEVGWGVMIRRCC